MAQIEIHAGDFQEGKNHSFNFGVFALRAPGSWLSTETIMGTEVEEVTLATEENVKRLGGTVGWGVTGAVLLGPVGLLAGLLMGGRSKQVTFIVRFKDGRKFLGTTDAKAFTKIQALAF